MPYYLLSSALLLLTLLPLFQNQSRKSTCWPWYHFGNICFLHNICRPSLLQDERLCFDDYFKVHNIWILVSTFNSSIPQQNSMQHPFQYIPSSMPLDFLSEVTPALNILTSLIYYGTTFYLGPHWFFPWTLQNDKKIFLHSPSETTKLSYYIITVSLVFLTLNNPPSPHF